MAYFWSVDGDLINPSGRKASGLTEIQRLFADEHGQNGPMKQSTYKSVSAKIRFLEPTLALLDQDIEISGITAPDGSMVTQKSHVAALLRKSGGQWWKPSEKPQGWDFQEQIKQIPTDIPRH